VPSEEKVSRFLPTPLALLAVTSHAPTNVGLDVATRIGELSDVFDSGLAQDDKTAALAMTAKTRINIRSLHSKQETSSVNYAPIITSSQRQIAFPGELAIVLGSSVASGPGACSARG